jgi:hypothetical protein
MDSVAIARDDSELTDAGVDAEIVGGDGEQQPVRLTRMGTTLITMSVAAPALCINPRCSAPLGAAR